MSDDMRIQLANIERAVGRIEGTLDTIKIGLGRGTDRMDKHDGRIRKLENRQHRSAGFAGGIGAMLGAVAGVVGAKLGWPTHP
jgi:hypothetical protein